jgi:putative addiction module antidote
MKIKIRKIGNSLGILIPKDTLSLLHLKEGDELGFEIKVNQIELILKKT